MSLSGAGGPGRTRVASEIDANEVPGSSRVQTPVRIGEFTAAAVTRPDDPGCLPNTYQYSCEPRPLHALRCDLLPVG